MLLDTLSYLLLPPPLPVARAEIVRDVGVCMDTAIETTDFSCAWSAFRSMGALVFEGLFEGLRQRWWEE